MPIENKRILIGPRGDEPLPLEDLLKLYKVDTEIWKVDRFLPNSWPIGVKVEDKDITFDAGVMTGHIRSSGEINTKRLYQSKAWLSRRVLVPSKIPIHQVTVRIRKTKSVRPKKTGLKNAMILTDPQFGFLKAVNKPGAIPLHDRVAIDAAFQVALDVLPDVFVWGGDILDLSEWSIHFLKRPEFQMTTQAALIEASWSIGNFVRAFPDAIHVVMLGNHDNRMETYLIRNMKEVYEMRPADQLDEPSMVSIDNLLGLSRMGVHYVGDYPDGEWWLNEFLKVIHGKTTQPASKVVQGAVVNQAFGHLHRQQIASGRVVGKTIDRPIWAATSGCLCHIDGRVPGSTNDRNWQKGVMVVQYDDADFVGFPEFARILDGCALFRGCRYEGQDKFEDLVYSTKDSFDWNSYKPLGFQKTLN